MKIKIFTTVLFALIFSIEAFAQLKDLSGVVIANGDVEGIHILNKTSVKYTVTDTDGTFTILVKPNDTLTVSSLKYQTKEVVIMPAIISENNLRVYLNEKINELDEVVVGKILSGSLDSDINNFGKETDVNFYDLGIPGYIGKPKTLPERKLADADGGGWGSINGGPFGGGVGLNVHKILNRISGRTKKLKAIVDLDERDKCRQAIKEEYGGAIFETEEFTEASKADYFYFCMDDENFKDICNRNDPTEILPFLKNKLIAYKVNLNSDKD